MDNIKPLISTESKGTEHWALNAQSSWYGFFASKF
jgi:hypothetical protein